MRLLQRHDSACARDGRDRLERIRAQEAAEDRAAMTCSCDRPIRDRSYLRRWLCRRCGKLGRKEI
jgi:hypothetical protein